MNRFFRFLLTIFFGAFGTSFLQIHAQTLQVPHKMNFAGMSLTIHDDARAEIQKDVDALTRSPKYFNIKVERARSYFPIIEAIFKEEKVPDDLKYLVLQESALIPDAVSTSNAVGYWQFKEATARDFGLLVNSTVDDRMNIASATRGAARYFKKSNSYFNNWLLVIQSYQMGIGGTMRSIGEKYNGLRHMDVTSETYWYIKKFLAHKIAFENSWSGIPQIVLTTVAINAETTLEDLARKRGVPLERLMEYNKWAKTGIIPGDREYVVVFPAGERALESTPIVSIQKPKEPTVVVQEGILTVNGLKALRAGRNENLVSLAERGKVSVKRLIKWNEIEASHRPSEGQVYYLQAKQRSPMLSEFTTAGGETLWSLSQQLGIRKSTILKFNPAINEGQLKAGLVLRFVAVQATKPVRSTIGVDPRRPFDWSTGQ